MSVRPQRERPVPRVRALPPDRDGRVVFVAVHVAVLERMLDHLQGFRTCLRPSIEAQMIADLDALAALVPEGTARRPEAAVADAVAALPAHTVADAAALLGLSCRQVRQLIADGRLLATRPPGRRAWSVDPASLTAVAAQRRPHDTRRDRPATVGGMTESWRTTYRPAPAVPFQHAVLSTHDAAPAMPFTPSLSRHDDMPRSPWAIPPADPDDDELAALAAHQEATRTLHAAEAAWADASRRTAAIEDRIEQLALSGRATGMTQLRDELWEAEHAVDDARLAVLDARRLQLAAQWPAEGRKADRLRRYSDDLAALARKATEAAERASDDARRAEYSWNTAQEGERAAWHEFLRLDEAVQAKRAARVAELRQVG